MRTATCVADLDVVDREAGRHEPVVGPGVNHHRRMRSVEGAALEHEDLAATTLFCRRAEHRDCQPDVVCHRCECSSCTDRRRRDDVVSACVADTWQCVVFGTDDYVHRTVPGSADDRGLEAVVTRRDAQARGLE